MAVSSLIVRRSICRPQNRVPRRGYVFDDDDENRNFTLRSKEQYASSRNARQSNVSAKQIEVAEDAASPPFIFNIKKRSYEKCLTFDAAKASEALLKQQKAIAKRKLQRTRATKRKALEELDVKRSSELQADANACKHTELFDLLQNHVKREHKRVKRHFARSSARQDIIEITEKGFEAMKDEFVQFLKKCPPSNTAPKNHENPKSLYAQTLANDHENAMKKLEKEEETWYCIGECILMAEQDSRAGAAILAHYGIKDISPKAIEQTKEDGTSIACQNQSELEELIHRQKEVLIKVEQTADQLPLVDDAITSMRQLVTFAELKKHRLFDSVHHTAFKNYIHFQQPKENLRVLLRLGPNEEIINETL